MYKYCNEFDTLKTDFQINKEVLDQLEKPAIESYLVHIINFKWIS